MSEGNSLVSYPLPLLFCYKLLAPLLPLFTVTVDGYFFVFSVVMTEIGTVDP
jgi:hypothetical protein